MKGINKTVKWTKKFKALIISLGLAFVVALGGAGAAIGVSLSDNNGRFGGYSAGGVADNNAPSFTIGETVEIATASDWEKVIAVNSSANAYAEAKLTKNITATSGSFGTAANAYNGGALNVPAGKYIVLNLNGYTVNRGLTEVIDNGSVIINSGNLVIQDSSAKANGKITGGHDYVGGGIKSLPQSKLVLLSGSITGNTAEHNGGAVSLGTATFEMYGGSISRNTTGSLGGVQVGANSSFTMNGGEISNNTAGNGGGIYVTSTAKFTMSGGAISNNTASELGGGIYSAAAGVKNASGAITTYGLTLNGGNIFGNTADTGKGGGGVYATGTFEMNGGYIYKNVANADIVTTTNGRESGGAGVYVENGTFTLNDGYIGTDAQGRKDVPNVAKRGDGVGVQVLNGTFNMNGGSIVYHRASTGGVATGIAGAVRFNNGTFNMTDGLIAHNYMTASGGGVVLCGGEAVQMTMSGGTITDNSVATSGGGIYANANATLTINGGEISNNTAPRGGGIFMDSKSEKIDVDGTETTKITSSTLTVNGGTISNNISNGANSTSVGGGGIYVGAHVKFKMHGGTMSGNSATSRGGAIYFNVNTEDNYYVIDKTNGAVVMENNYAGAVGGAIYTFFDVFLNIDGATISNNSSGTRGGGIGMSSRTVGEFKNLTVTDNTTKEIGGGIMLYDQDNILDMELTIKNCTITGNTAGTSGGGIYLGSQTVTVEGCTISNNTAAYGNGGGIFSSGALTITSGTISNNSALGKDDGAGSSYGARRGGGIWFEGTEINVGVEDNTTDVVEITGNNSAWSGGGVYAYGSKVTEVNFYNVKFLQNHATGDGGAYCHIQFATGVTPLFKGCEFTNNVADASGGAAYLSRGGNTIQSCTFTGNKSTTGGGAIYFLGGASSDTSEIKTSTLSGNTAGSNGGGFMIASGNTVKATNCTISGNKALAYGGGVFNLGIFEMSGTTLYDNEAVNGGGMYINGGTTKFSNVKIYGNSSENKDGNTAGNHGGGVYHKVGSVYFNDEIIIRNNTSSGLSDNWYRDTISAECMAQTLASTSEIWIGASVETLVICVPNNTALNYIKVDNPTYWERSNLTRTEPVGSYNVKLTPKTISGTLADRWKTAVTTSISTKKPQLFELTEDWTATSGKFGTDATAFYSGALNVPAGCEIVLDLKNYNLTNTTARAITVKGKLTIKGSGTITGGTMTEGHGAVINVNTNGELILNGGTFTGGTTPSGYNGGGIALIDGGKLTMNGGTISGNTTGNYGGGVYVSEDSTFTMNGGTISGNTAAANGAGVYVAEGGKFTMNGGTIGGSDANKNTASERGGGVHVEGTGTFTMNGGTISYNTSLRGGGISGYSGAEINVSGSANIANNKATRANGDGGYGGGIWINTSTLNISGGKIHGNNAQLTGGGIIAIGEVNISGGEIYSNTSSNGGGIQLSSGTLTVTGGKIYNNTASVNGGGVHIGKSTDPDSTPSCFEMTGGEISGNTVTATADQTRGGAGVYVAGTFTMTGGKISDNRAEDDTDETTKTKNTYGGGVYVTQGGTFNLGKEENGSYVGTGVISGNYSVIDAGGVYVYSSSTATATDPKATLNIYSGTISGNTAKYGGGAYMWGAASVCTMYGGVVSGNTASISGSGMSVSSGSTFTMNGGTISGNNATTNGGGVFVGGATFTLNGGTISNNTAQNGGGVYSLGTFKMNGGTIKGNTATLMSDTVDTAYAGGGGVYLSSAAFTMTAGEISGNSAVQGAGILATAWSNASGTGITAAPATKPVINISGGKICNNTSSASGGGIFGAGIKLTISDTAVVSENKSSSNHGGGITFTRYTEGKISGGEISGNSATNGGAVYVFAEATLTITGGAIAGNTATASGGGIFAEGSTLTISSGEIYENTAKRGGGLVVRYSVFTLSGTAKVHDNYAKAVDDDGGHGGGMYLQTTTTNPNGTYKIEGGEIYNNVADSQGGAIILNGGLTLTISGGEIYGNTADKGGAIRMDPGCTVNFTKGSIHDNIAKSNGGAVDISAATTGASPVPAATLTMSGTAVISGNSARFGGGVYVSGNFNMNGGEISGNTSDGGGAGAYVAFGAQVTVTKGDILNNTAGGHGGGFYLIGGSTLTMTGTRTNGVDSIKIIGNSSNNVGGGICSNGTLKMTNVTVDGNTSGENGGGIGAAINVELTNVTVTNNVSISGGGLTLSNATVSGLTVTGNTVTNKGGGIYIGGTFNISGKNVITGNTSDGKASNVYLASNEVMTVTGALNAESRIGVTTASTTLPVVITSGYNGKTGHNATFARTVFFADKEGLVAVHNGTEVQLAQGVILTVQDESGNKLGSISTVSGATVTGSFNETTRTYTLSETGALANNSGVAFASETIPEGYAVYMYSYGDADKTEKTSITMGNTAATVILAKKALSRNYTVRYYLQGTDGNYGTTYYEATASGLTGSDVAPLKEDGTPFSNQIPTPEQYSLDSTQGNWQTAKVAGDNSTVVNVYLKLGKYKVRFTENGTTLLVTKEYFYGETIQKDPADATNIKVLGVNNPSKNLNTFAGWYLDAEFEHPLFENGNVVVRSDLTIYAKYDTQKFSLTFDLNLGMGEGMLNLNNALDNKGANLQTVNSALGGKVTWDYERLFNNTFNWAEGSKNGTYTIAYDVNNVSRFGLSLTGITPSAIGYRFDGWYVGDTRRTVISQPTASTRPITLKAQWSLEEYSITLNKMERSTAASSSTQTVRPTNLNYWKDILPTAPTRSDGYVFLGWYRTEADAKNAATDSSIRDIYFWSTNGRDGFDETEWSETTQFSIADFGYINESGYVFNEYGDGSLESPYDFGGLTLYAGWKSIDVYVRGANLQHGSLTFRFYNNNTLGSQISANTIVKIGDTIQVTANVSSGYVLSSVKVGSGTTASTLKPSKTEPTIVRFTVNNRYLVRDENNADRQYVDVSAVFEEQAYSIIYRYDGGTKDRNETARTTYTISQVENDTLILPSKVTKLGYDFRGWMFVKDVGGVETIIGETPAHEMDDMYLTGDLYGEAMWLAEPAEYAGIILKAQWEAQPSHVYLYNAAYELLQNDPRVQDYQPNEADSSYVVSSIGTEDITTGLTVEIVNPMRNSFTFLGWGTSRNGVVVYPVEYDNETGLAKDTISYKVEAHADRAGTKLDRNNLYAIWQIEGVDYINITATNNGSTYGGNGIVLTANPAQTYAADSGESITITYTWYKVFEGMYDSCFIEKEFVNDAGYMVFVDEGGNPVAFQKGTEYYGATASGAVDQSETLTREQAEARGTKLTFKEFNPASVDVSCEWMFEKEITVENNAKTSSTVTIRNVQDCGTYICDVRVQASVGDTSTKAGGYGEIEITMSKAEFEGLRLADASVQYDSTAKNEIIKLSVVNGSGATYNYATGILTLPDTVARDGKTRTGSRLIVTYKYYTGEGNNLVEITDLNQIKKAGTYHVEVSFEFLSGGDNGNYELIEPIWADLVITPYTIGSIGAKFMHGDTEVGGSAPYHATYDGDPYSVNLSILDKIELVGGTLIDVANDGVQLEVNVYKETVNGWVKLAANEVTTDAGSYYIEIVGLKGSGAGNYELGSMNTLRYSYTIDKKAYNVEIGWVGEKTVTFDNVAHVLKVEEEKLPDTLEVEYTTVYTSVAAGYEPTVSANGGVDAGTYVVTATFSFKDAAVANNYEALPAMTETLVIERADLLDYFKNSPAHNEDLLVGGNFVNASYAYVTGAKHNPHVESGSLTNTTNFTLTYEYYLLSEDGSGRTLIGSGTHSSLVNQGNLISEAGTYEVVLRIAYANIRYRNDFLDVPEEKSTVTCLIEKGTVQSVSVVWKSDAAWASGTAKKVNLGDDFDFNWIERIEVMFVGSTIPKTIEGDAIKLAVIGFDSENQTYTLHTNFWHVGALNVEVSYYGTPCNNEFTVYQAIEDVTVEYCIAGGTYAPVPEDGIPYRAENDYVFRIRYTGTDVNGEVVNALYTRVEKSGGALALGKNVLTPKANDGETLYYTFAKADVSVNVYKVVDTASITWQYRVKGSNGEWKDINKETYSIDYAGAEYEVRAKFTGDGNDGVQQVMATLAEGLVLRNYRSSGYSLKFGTTENGKYLVTDEPVIHIAKLQLTLKWDTDTKVYNGGRALAPVVVAPTDGSKFITAADTGLVTFKYSYKKLDGTTVESMTGVGEYVVTAELDGDAELKANYAIFANAENEFEITPAAIDMTVTYSESTYGVNRTYEGNRELRLTALQKNFNGGATVDGDFYFLSGSAATFDSSLVVDGRTLAETVLATKLTAEQTSRTETIYYAYVPKSGNYKVAIGSISLTVLKQAARTGTGSLSLALGENATRIYLKGATVNTHGIIVYRLYQSAYQEGNKWYGRIVDITDGTPKPSFRVGDWDAESYVIRDRDVTNQYVEIKAISGSDSGTIRIPVTDRIPDDLAITAGSTYKTVYYVGEQYDFSDIDFTVTFPGAAGGSSESQSGFKYGSITSNVSEFTDANGRFTTPDTITITFNYIDTECTAQFEIRAKDTLTVELPANRRTLVLKDGKVVTQPQLTFKLADGTTIVPEGVAYVVKVFRGNMELGEIADIEQTGSYELVFEFNITNPRFNALENYSVPVVVTENPYSATVTLPTEGLNKVYTGNGISIPRPTISNVINSSDGSTVSNYTVVYKINGVDAVWTQTARGTYVVTIEVLIDGTDFSAILNEDTYTFEITQAENTAETVVPEFVILGKTEFDFKVTSKFGTDRVVQYKTASSGWSTNVPNHAGMWTVRITIPGTNDYKDVVIEREFEVRNPDAVSENGSVEGGNGISDSWTLEITQMASEEVSQVSISKQNVLDGYKVELKNGENYVTGEGEYTVRVKLPEELSGRTDIKVFFIDANGKTSSRSAKVEDGYVVFKTSEFGTFMITSEIPKESVGLLVAVIVLGVLAAAGIAACIIVFLKKRKRGAK